MWVPALFPTREQAPSPVDFRRGEITDGWGFWIEAGEWWSRASFYRWLYCALWVFQPLLFFNLPLLPPLPTHMKTNSRCPESIYWINAENEAHFFVAKDSRSQTRLLNGITWDLFRNLLSCPSNPKFTLSHTHTYWSESPGLGSELMFFKAAQVTLTCGQFGISWVRIWSRW